MLSAPYLDYLPTYVFFPLCQHLFEVTDLTTRGCSFFGDSNRPTLFICYQGSIEKLTLLGAIYYYYYLSPIIPPYSYE
jgi:hypothetical protein